VRPDCLIRGNAPEPQERTMTITVSRRNALYLTAVATALPLVGVMHPADAQEAPLAIKGYDPVAYFTDGKPVRGTAEFEYEWDDRRWRFASAEHRDLFKASPVRYAPQFGNYCAMALALNKVVVADPENWLISDGKLYVFGKPAPAGPELFKQDLTENISKSNSNRLILPKQ
jgi:YHS domain-containing protein